VTFVAVYDFRFHPENVTVRSGGTVVWLWADELGPTNHDPRSSGSTGSVTLDKLKPSPTALGACFWNLLDQGHLLGQGGVAGNGDAYNLTLRSPSAGRIEKSAGMGSGSLPLLGSPPHAQPFSPCPAGTASVTLEGAMVFPYHCGVHAAPGGSEPGMRGTITVVV
jgi:plastocyanin